MHPGTDNSGRPFLPKARRGKERESCHQDNILQQECSMGEDPLTRAVDIDRAMQLLPKLCLGAGVGIVFSEFFLLFLISCHRLPLDELNKKAKGMEASFTEVSLLRQRRGQRKVENGYEEHWRLISTIIHVDLSSSRLSQEMTMWPLVAQTHILLKLQWKDKFSLPVALAKALEVLSP